MQQLNSVRRDHYVAILQCDGSALFPSKNKFENYVLLRMVMVESCKATEHWGKGQKVYLQG